MSEGGGALTALPAMNFFWFPYPRLAETPLRRLGVAATSYTGYNGTRDQRDKAMFCTHCGKQIDKADQFCVSCGKSSRLRAKPSSGGQWKSVPAFWIEDRTKLLKGILPQNVQESPYYPNDQFYCQYYNDPLAALHFKAQVIFSLLNIEPCGCVIDFCDEKEFREHLSSDTAGLFTTFKDGDGREKELIFINSKYKNDTLAVGAILAHEMMHLYLSRLNLRLQDTQENELLTDLATINTGLSILILNGMSYSSDWWLTIIMAAFGRIYWREQKLAFGYFKPDEYARHSVSYFNDRSIPVQNFIGYLSPASRHFVPHRSIKRRASTEFIRLLEKRHMKANAIKGGVAAVVVLPLLAWAFVSEIENHRLKEQIQDCKAGVLSLETKIDGDEADLRHLDEQLAKYKISGDIKHFNNLVDPYNSLMAEVKGEVTQYEAKRAACNQIIDNFNKRQ